MTTFDTQKLLRPYSAPDLHPSALSHLATITTTTQTESHPIEYHVVPPEVSAGIQQAAWASLLTLAVGAVVLWRVGVQLAKPVGQFFDKQSSRLESINTHLMEAKYSDDSVKSTLGRVEARLELVHDDLKRLRP